MIKIEDISSNRNELIKAERKTEWSFQNYQLDVKTITKMEILKPFSATDFDASKKI